MTFLHTFLTEATTQATTQAAQEAGGAAAPFTGMVDMLDLFLLVMLVGCGGYMLYTAFRLHREQLLFSSKLLYPGNCPPEECADEGGFIDFIIPRTVIMGSSMLLIGIFLGLNSFLFKWEAMWIDILMLILPVSLFSWYVVIQRKAAKLFW